VSDGGVVTDGTSGALSQEMLRYLQLMKKHVTFQTNGKGEATSISIAGKLTVDLKSNIVRVESANLQIVNGTGKTASENSLGNVIVGYNENVQSPKRNGSHNLIVGAGHEYVSHGGFVAGYKNHLLGPYASIAGGQSNTAVSERSSILGGEGNTVNQSFSTICGGQGNNTQGRYSSVFGGRGNRAAGLFSTVVAGDGNTAAGEYSTVLSGSSLRADGKKESVLGAKSAGGACLVKDVCQ
tara:strand:- start:5663 stop:6379 length:717 start_codon:yes stop_codon:yes gene_type:complete